MMEINASNENAMVRLIGKNVEQDSCAVVKQRDTLSPLPSLETLSISTESTEASSNHSKESEDFNDCSSSVSSQDSNNFVASGNGIASRTVKRSVFSQYWQKTGQKPVLLRPIKSPSTSDQNTTQDAPTSISTLTSNISSLHYPLDKSIASLSNADLLEDDDCDSSVEEDEPKPPMEEVCSNPPLVRRRSILPPAPMSHPALRSWRKSASLSNVEGYCHQNKLAHKTRSLPRMRSSSMVVQPGPSCLRPYQRYSPSKTKEVSPQVSPARILSRSDSSSSSVSFQEAVDVRHFEPPQLNYAGKGWSDYFN